MPRCPLAFCLQSPRFRSRCVKAGTEEKLVLHLLHAFSMSDSSFVSIFLSTYRSFTTTERVLGVLADRYGAPGSHGRGGKGTREKRKGNQGEEEKEPRRGGKEEREE